MISELKIFNGCWILIWMAKKIHFSTMKRWTCQTCQASFSVHFQKVGKNFMISFSNSSCLFMKKFFFINIYLRIRVKIKSSNSLWPWVYFNANLGPVLLCSHTFKCATNSGTFENATNILVAKNCHWELNKITALSKIVLLFNLPLVLLKYRLLIV